MTGTQPLRIGPYLVIRRLGAGGMGIVYEARDERLGRTVAVKILAGPGDETARRRFLREARAAAKVNHPHICQVHELGEHADGQLFIAMERLEGESLADALERGPLSVAQAVPVALDVLSALSALHAHGLVHRDLKPSNIFLTPHGVKLLDFGLAQLDADTALDDSVITRTGLIVGTPRYMAPEQIEGGGADPRTDLFAAGAILFETLAGRPAFPGRTMVEVLHATVHEQPPALGGSPAVTAVDRVIRHALAKAPADRPPSADAMAAELRAISGTSDHTGAAVIAQAFTRLVVLPFRMLRPDPEIDFLAFSLPDEIATSLAGSNTLVVRSTASASRFGGEAPDLGALAAAADVDRVVLGTLLRSGDQVRAVAQLVEAPAGTLLASHTVQAPLGDLFALQDDLARRLAAALSAPLAGGTTRSSGDRPADPRAYELFLRANELARTYDGLPAARDRYQQCLERDPRFAPAWARLGRCHRVIGKYVESSPESSERAAEAFQRALDINPRLSLAHKYFANLEADSGEAPRAVVRLLGEASRHGNDPELFAGLVHACRYAGLFEQSVAAHAEARRLDPHVPTSIEQTVLMTLDIERLMRIEPPQVVAGGDNGIRVIGLGLAGRRDEARAALLAMRQVTTIPVFQKWTGYLLAWLDRHVEPMLTGIEALTPLAIRTDPEAMFQEGWLLCDAGAHERGLPMLERAVGIGYFPVATLERAPQFDALRGQPAFDRLLASATAGRDRAYDAFCEAGGDRLVGR